jgi:hypothetical protein
MADVTLMILSLAWANSAGCVPEADPEPWAAGLIKAFSFEDFAVILSNRPGKCQRLVLFSQDALALRDWCNSLGPGMDLRSESGGEVLHVVPSTSYA